MDRFFGMLQPKGQAAAPPAKSPNNAQPIAALGGVNQGMAEFNQVRRERPAGENAVKAAVFAGAGAAGAAAVMGAELAEAHGHAVKENFHRMVDHFQKQGMKHEEAMDKALDANQVGP